MSNGAGMSEAAVRESCNVSTAIDKVESANNRLNEVADLLETLEARLDGDKPSTSDQKNQPRENPAGQLPQLHMSIGVLHDKIGGIQARIERINGLV